MAKEKLSEMRSVSLTPTQDKALECQATKELRNPGSLIRLALCEYLVRQGALKVQDEDIDTNEE